MNIIRTVSRAFSCVLALAAAFAITPAFADGECLEWNVNGQWVIAQSNGTTVRMNLQQAGTHLQGVGEYSYYNKDADKVQTIGGPVDGYLERGSLVRVTAYWSDSSAGIYVGQVEADGAMSGYTADKNDPANKATFRASGSPQCVSRAAVAPPPPATPVMALGRVKAVTPGPTVTICEAAKSARARNSPAAPSLEKQCAAQGGPPPSLGFGRVTAPRAAPAPATPAPPTPAPPISPPPVDPAQLDALATKGAEIAGIDPTVAEARGVEAGAFYQLGFDIATGLFGDPVLGAAGKASMDAGSASIRDSLSASGQRGFDASMKVHLARMHP